MSTTLIDKRTTPWQLDPEHSLVEFSVKHMMIATVRGRFEQLEGTIVLDPADPTTATINVSIEAASIRTGIEARDQHLRSPDFLDAAGHPRLTFRSTSVRRLDGDTFEVVGDLTIRDVTRPVTLVARSLGMVTDPWGVERIGYSATTKIVRQDFGLTWNMVAEAGGVLVGDEVKIAIEAELVRPGD
jgi:polyisoprenoid-binding protein YceI